MVNKLAIVCGSPSSEMDAPFDDETYDIWVLGNRYDRYEDKRVTCIFEIHDDLSEHNAGYVKWLVDTKIPLVVGKKFPWAGGNVNVFPFDEAEKLLGQTYLTSSPAYMMAKAILDGYRHIEIYGVDMAVHDHEYFWQRPCMEGWVGFAKGS